MTQTVEQFLLGHLYNNGLFEDQAKQVLEIFKSEDAAKSIRLSGDIDQYPPIMRPVMLMSVDRAALQWIDKEMPNHWARPMFDPKMADELNAIKNEPGFNAAMERINAAPDVKSFNVDFEHESSLHLELGMSKLGAVPRFDVGQPRGDFEGDVPTFKNTHHGVLGSDTKERMYLTNVSSDSIKTNICHTGKDLGPETKLEGLAGLLGTAVGVSHLTSPSGKPLMLLSSEHGPEYPTQSPGMGRYYSEVSADFDGETVVATTARKKGRPSVAGGKARYRKAAKYAQMKGHVKQKPLIYFDIEEEGVIFPTEIAAAPSMRSLPNRSLGESEITYDARRTYLLHHTNHPLFANAPETGVDVVGAAYLSAFMDFNPLASFNPEVKSGNDVAATPDQAPGETDPSAFE